jgi:hypothetical protein
LVKSFSIPPEIGTSNNTGSPPKLLVKSSSTPPDITTHESTQDKHDEQIGSISSQTQGGNEIDSKSSSPKELLHSQSNSPCNNADFPAAMSPKALLNQTVPQDNVNDSKISPKALLSQNHDSENAEVRNPMVSPAAVDVANASNLDDSNEEEEEPVVDYRDSNMLKEYENDDEAAADSKPVGCSQCNVM